MFPVIASVYWTRVTNTAFSTAVIVALLAYVVARFEIVPLSSPALYVLETFSIVGGGVVVGLMTFAFLGRRAGLVVGAVVAVALAPFFWGFVRDYAELFAVTVAYGLSTVLCVGITLASRHEFDFDTIKDNVTAFQAGTTADPELTRAEGAG